jgi:hypothetical protein
MRPRRRRKTEPKGMRFRLKAFGLHASASLLLLTLTFAALYFGWYRWPGWYLAGAPPVVAVVVLVDLALGPSLTLIIANPAKPRRELARDIAVIAVVQLVALVYGAATLWSGRPLYYAFSVNRLEMVAAADLPPEEIALARQQNPALAPHWYNLTRWVWAPLPQNQAEADRILKSSILGGQDVVQMPRYFKPWEQGLPSLHEQLTTLDKIKQLTVPQQQTLRARMTRLGLAPEQPNALLMWGDLRRVLVIFDPGTRRIRAILEP